MAITKVFKTFGVSMIEDPTENFKLEAKAKVNEIAIDRDLNQLIYTINKLIDSIGGGIPVAFADLPTGSLGMIATVTNSNTATWGATIAGGGANNVLAWYNGTNWKVIGA